MQVLLRRRVARSIAVRRLPGDRAGLRHPEVRAGPGVPRQDLPDKKFEPTRARTAAELTLALADGAPDPVGLAERFLRANLSKELERRGNEDAAVGEVWLGATLHEL